MRIYDIAVAGAGAAGTMAAICAGRLKKSVVLVERNTSLGKKILLTGGGRCNITHKGDISRFISAFGKQGSFYREAFSAFSNQDLTVFFNQKGAGLKEEGDGRVFPASGNASSIVKVLYGYLQESKADVLYDTRLTNIKEQNDLFCLDAENRDKIYAKKVVLATGGVSYGHTGSSGDGLRIAKKIGHSVMPLMPALVPLKVKEYWVKRLQGLAVKRARIVYSCGGIKNISPAGEIIFTHFGISGPLILDISGGIVLALARGKAVPIFIDFEPESEFEQLEYRLSREFNKKKNAKLKNVMQAFLPNRLVSVFFSLIGIDSGKKANQLSRQERHLITRWLKNVPLTVTGALSFDEAMVTNGGVLMKEINPRTMESRIVPGLYFAGEIIEGCGLSGGYNLQQAFSTGNLAGKGAANA